MTSTKTNQELAEDAWYEAQAKWNDRDGYVQIIKGYLDMKDHQHLKLKEALESFLIADATQDLQTAKKSFVHLIHTAHIKGYHQCSICQP